MTNRFSWGYGGLGRGPSALAPDNEPKEIPLTLFGNNELNSNSKPAKTFAGLGFFFVQTNNREVIKLYYLI